MGHARNPFWVITASFYTNPPSLHQNPPSLHRYHLAQFGHPNIARLLHHYVSPTPSPQITIFPLVPASTLSKTTAVKV